MSHIFCWTQGALKTTEGKAEVPSLDKEGWLRPLRKCREASLAGVDGVVGSSHRLSEVERTTPAAPPKERDHLLDAAATPPLPRRGLRLSLRLSQTPVSSGRLVGNDQLTEEGRLRHQKNAAEGDRFGRRRGGQSKRSISASLFLDAPPPLLSQEGNSCVRIPISTYRLQFNCDFRFEDARRIVDYLYELGITDIYASPLLKARPGSTHGYDVTDPTHLNPELGTAEEFDQLSRALQARDMGLILDIVPNH